MTELEKLQKEYEQARYEYQVAEREFQMYGGLWYKSESDQAWSYMNKLRLKMKKLMEEE